MSLSEPKSSACSRLFRVKDKEAFIDDLNMIEDVETGSRVVAGIEYQFVYVENSSWPLTRTTEDGDVEIDFPHVISEHLADDQVAVLESVSHTPRDLIAESIAINSRGQAVRVDFDDLAAAAIQELSTEDGDNANGLVPSGTLVADAPLEARINIEYLLTSDEEDDTDEADIPESQDLEEASDTEDV